MSFASNRLLKEHSKIKSEPIEGFTFLESENLFVVKGYLHGVNDTPYENGKFLLQMTFDESYPVKAPSIKFLVPMYHPNIYRDGKICIDILQNEWTPAQNVRTILYSIRSLLMDPNPSSPANREAAELYNKDRTAYENKVRDCIKNNKK